MKLQTSAQEAARPGHTKKLYSVGIALAAVYLFWGGTYLGMKIAIETLPPFLMAGVRFLAAGGFLYALARLKGTPRPKARDWQNPGIVGALLLLGGNGVVAWAEQRVPSAIASLLVATVPLWMIGIHWVSGNRSKPSRGTLPGLLLGLAGIAILANPFGAAGTGRLDVPGVAALLAASISWAVGSLYSRTARMPDSPLMSTAMQMLAGGGLLLLLSLALGDWSSLDIAAVSLRSYLALGYLIGFGSVIGYTAYIWLLKNAEPAVVSTYAFVNPIVAVLLGWLVAGEPLTAAVWFSTAAIIAAVMMITLFRSKAK